MVKRYTVSSGQSDFPFFFQEDPPTDEFGQQAMVLASDYDALAAALDRYGAHEVECLWDIAVDPECTCGFDAALKAPTESRR